MFGSLEYATDLVEPAEADRLAARFEEILGENIAEYPVPDDARSGPGHRVPGPFHRALSVLPVVFPPAPPLHSI